MGRSHLFLWLWLLSLCAANPTRRVGQGARGAHGALRGRARGPRPMLLDQHAAGDYRVDDAAYIDDDYQNIFKDTEYEVTPERKPEDYYPEEEEDVSTSAHPPPPPAHGPGTRKPKRYQNGTLYDDYVGQCAGLMSAAEVTRAHPVHAVLAALVAAVAMTFVFK